MFSSSTSDLFPLSHGRRIVALLIFTLSVFVDVLCSSAFFVFIGPVAEDLGVVFQQQTWIINSYAVTFAAFLLFWGGVLDLYPAKTVFTAGFVIVGLCNLVLSFLTDAYAFFVIRALQGVAAASVVPSAYRLIACTFPPAERQRAYTLYGMTGSIANVTATIIAGVIDLIPSGGQMRSWRWFLRIVAAVSLPAALMSHLLIPRDRLENEKRGGWKQLDFIGILSILSAIILLILGLTLGASYGWTSASFLAPFLLAAVLLPFFFWWETRVPEAHALLPPSIWRIPNVPVLVLFALITLGWWAVNFVPFIELFHEVHGEKTIIAAVRTLPEGVAAGAISVVLVMRPGLIQHPKWPIITSMVLCTAAYVLWTQAPSVVGRDYWRFVFPGMLIGSGGMQTVLLATNVGVMLAAPPSKAAVVGAALQASMQTSTVVALAIQAGLLTLRPGGIYEFANVRASWYFELGWTVLWLLGFLLLYRSGRETHHEQMLASVEAEKGAEEREGRPADVTAATGLK